MLLLLLLGPAFSQGKKAPAKSGKPPATPNAAPAQEPPKSPAERVSGVLEEFIIQADLHNRGQNPPEKVVRLSETELNAYMQHAVTRKTRYGIQSVYIKLMGGNRLGTTTTIDFDKVKVEDENLAVRMVRSLLSGEKQIYVEGVVTSDKGMGQFSLEKAYFGNVRLPVYFIEKVINFLGHRQIPPVDTSKPVPLPYGLKKLEVDDGSIVLRS
jgi:hypothetical protein